MKVQTVEFDQTSELANGLTEYAQNVIQRPNRYNIDDNLYDPNNRPQIDEYDSSIPGVSDQFILSHDLNSPFFRDTGGVSHKIETNLYAWVYHISLPPFDLTKEMLEYVESKTGKQMTEIRGKFFYPETGYMGWHTNSDSPGLRVYIAYSEDGSSQFKWVDRSDPENPKVVVSQDQPGWNIRTFYVSLLPEDFLWHCVETSNTPRISFGFKFE